MEVITYAIPFFFLSIGIELLYTRLARKPYYRLTDSLNDLACGILSQFAGLAFVFLTIGIYALTYQHLRLTSLPADGSWAGIAVWVIAFVAVDHQYYWFHRKSHEWQLLWASHSVHHQSEEYNLTVALRQSATPFFGWPFYLPLALVGVAPEVFAVCYSVNLVYQFFIHTRAIDRLHPWLEAVLNTPSHHRVHHGKNPKYCDRNHAGVFIIWDRLYGSFIHEEDEPVYGITVPLNSWNPLWANLIGYAHLFSDMWRTSSWRDKLRAPFMPPGWRPADLGPSIAPREVSAATHQVFETPASPALHQYAFVQFVLSIPAALYLLLAVNTMPTWQALALAFIVTLTLVNLGALYEQKSWARTSELARLISLLAVGVLLSVSGHLMLGLALIVLMALSLWGLRRALTAPAPVAVI
jgi:alkylglycerol monooxygenase